MLDSTIVRAPQHAAGAKGGQQNEALGRSRGGFSTKIQAVCDALDHPLRLILTGGQAADCRQALALLDGWKADAVLADKGYDAHYIIDAVSGRNALVVIPPRANRKRQREYDMELYQSATSWSGCSTSSSTSAESPPAMTKPPSVSCPFLTWQLSASGSSECPHDLDLADQVGWKNVRNIRTGGGSPDKTEVERKHQLQRLLACQCTRCTL
jgi:hypothetical protein